MKRLRWTVSAFQFLGALFVFGHSLAQAPQLPREMMSRELRSRGDSITFCLNTEGFMEELERRLASELADILLIQAEFFEYKHKFPPRPYDYSLMTNLEDIYYLLLNECDVFMSLLLPGDGELDWLEVTQALFSSGYVLVSNPSNPFQTLDDLPKGALVGTRLTSQADLDFGTYLRSGHQNRNILKVPYNDNALLFQRLMDGTLDAALIWEPALLAMEEQTSVLTARMDAGSFRLPRIQFAFGVLSRNRFLQTTLDNAIEVASSEKVLEGIIDQTLPGFALP